MADDPCAAVKSDLTATSMQISTQVRSIVLGVLAFVWLFLSGAKDIPGPMVSAMPKGQLILVAMLSIAALLADLLQYVAGYIYSLSVLRVCEASQKGPVFETTSLLYVLRTGLFWIKQAFAYVAVLWLLVLLARAVWA